MWSQPPPFHLTIETPLNPHPEISRHSFARSAVAKPHQLPTYDMMGGKSWEEVLAPHQRGGWEVLGGAGRCWGDCCCGAGIREAKQKGRLSELRRLGHFQLRSWGFSLRLPTKLYVSQNSCFPNRRGTTRDDTERKQLYFLAPAQNSGLRISPNTAVPQRASCKQPGYHFLL